MHSAKLTTAKPCTLAEGERPFRNESEMISIKTEALDDPTQGQIHCLKPKAPQTLHTEHRSLFNGTVQKHKGKCINKLN